MIATPGILILLLFFMLNPVLQSGAVNEKFIHTIASLIIAVIVTIPLLVLYILFAEHIMAFLNLIF